MAMRTAIISIPMMIVRSIFFCLLKKIRFIRLLYSCQRCYFFIDICIIVISVKFFLSHTLCENFYRKTCMSVGTKVYTALVIQDMCDGNGKRLIASVFHIFILAEFFLFSGSAHGGVICFFQLIILILGHNKTSVIGGFRMHICTVFLLGSSIVRNRSLKTEQFCYIFHNCIKIGFVFFISCHIVRIKFSIGNLLVIKILKEGIIVSSGITNGKTTCFMVTCYQDQSFVRMLIVEVHSLCNCIIQS